ncbi:MAG: flagellar hook-associated protein FlgL [Gammaproteobacteria bacterium]|nr:flagellar hook-associated protein FlgL [Gammaproteobacteria bacterium]
MRVSTSFIHMRGVQNMLDQQARLVETQDKVSRGEKYRVPSDNPNAASRVLDLNESISKITQYDENANYATQRLYLEESTLTSINNSLQRVRELSIQAANTGVNDLQSERAIAAEIREKIEELYDYANTKDESGDYLFSGFQSKTQAFTTDGLGNYFYNGDQGAINIQIGSNRQVKVNDSGADVFQMARNGNGTFSVDAHSTNSGLARISTGTVVDPNAYNADDFTITFANPPDTFDVVNKTTGATVLATQSYADGNVINFNGIEVEISGAPDAGDTFLVSASRNQDMFSSLSDLATVMESPEVGDIRGILGGDFIANGFAAGENITFDLSFDGIAAIPVTVNAPTPTNTEVATDIINSIALAPGAVTNPDGSYTINGTSSGVSMTFWHNTVTDEIEFRSDGATGTTINNLVVDNFVDPTNDAVISLTGSGNTLATNTVIDAAIPGDSVSFVPGIPSNVHLSQQIDNALNNIDRFMENIINTQTSIGGRINSIESQRDDNLDKKLYLETVRSDIKDLDLTEAISDLTYQTTALEAAQQTYVKVQSLNLFNYI